MIAVEYFLKENGHEADALLIFNSSFLMEEVVLLMLQVLLLLFQMQLLSN